MELARRALAHTSCVTAAHPEGYLSGPSCVEGRGLASLNQVVCALRFFYGVTLWPGDDPERIVYARAPRKLPTVLSGDEVVAFLLSVSSLKARVALTTAYAAGLPVSEVAVLKIGDIDSGRMVMRTEHGKGGKERYALLSATSAEQPAQLLAAHAVDAVSVSRPKPGPIEPIVLDAACRSAAAAAGLDK